MPLWDNVELWHPHPSWGDGGSQNPHAWDAAPETREGLCFGPCNVDSAPKSQRNLKMSEHPWQGMGPLEPVGVFAVSSSLLLLQPRAILCRGFAKPY